ncbi:LacI family DNA-binding transcriptional regulator [Endozoicomonas sp. SCSIO W0465]|uniref:LacI family DNA-binding transcriptional regulator n=1 Tax=Endozoicomonas sp. SCSIO W0465 TaxID=2918516 RepID=UPI0020752317|nr:LacI family DNA-binding transcriptional regulator [Endozoicomonas sp. SCSIO W0465]USE38208.1 LacI family transcriptional regulator [Endozoicomonas sp. SCSIO W0465]
MASIKDVAELAGVSRATVSRVLNETGQIREATRERVHKAMKKLNYRPNPLARSLATSSSNTVGLVVTSYRGSFFSELMAEVQEAMDQQEKFLLVSRGKRSRESEQLALQRLKDMRCDGLILHARNLYDEELIELAGEATPFIILDRQVEGLEDRCVAFEHAEAGKLAVNHLIEHGHRKIACLAGPRERLTAQLRFRGYEQALREHHIELDEALVAEADYDRAGGYRAMAEILAKHPDITAVYSCSEEMCVGAFDLFRERKITVPGDISMVSFDSVSICTMLTPAVTTVHFPIKEMAARASEALSGLMNHQPLSALETFKPELQQRESVRTLT